MKEKIVLLITLIMIFFASSVNAAPKWGDLGFCIGQNKYQIMNQYPDVMEYTLSDGQHYLQRTWFDDVTNATYTEYLRLNSLGIATDGVFRAKFRYTKDLWSAFNIFYTTFSKNPGEQHKISENEYIWILPNHRGIALDAKDDTMTICIVSSRKYQSD